MGTYRPNFISGAISGLAGAIAKSVVMNLRETTEARHYKISLSFKKGVNSLADKEKPVNKSNIIMDLGIGILGGIGSSVIFKKQERLTTKVTGGFLIGSISEYILQAARIKESKQDKTYLRLLGNGVYGFVTGTVDNVIKRYVFEGNRLDNYVEYMQIREKVEQQKKL